ncbi:Hypothetical predicted protein [Paramuricea clavata]|uniref:Uncharacterized protein n=1 Tax=Paramuricea clavata TaxID=317549 RepID=A0A7D9HJD7_PARCT|nr:Hypothetical predicted protein [Paramuricea clavata]
MDATEESWKDEVRGKLAEVFKDKGEDLCRVLFFLDEEDKAYKDYAARPYAPQWKSLKVTLENETAFLEFAKRLSNETRKAEKDQEFQKRMNIFYAETKSHSDTTTGIENDQASDPSLPLKCDSARFISVFGGLARAWSISPHESKASVLNFLRGMASEPAMVTAVDDAVNLVDKTGGTVVMVALAAVYLTYNAYDNIRRWWKGEISGKRCIKNVLDATFTIGAGMAGGAAGAAIGSVGGPVGAVVGSIVGGWVSAAGMSYLSDWMTQKLFGLPKEEALENAYRYLGVKMTASNAEVNTAFRKLCLQHHPDKGGNKEEFFKLQCNMAIIKQAREDF